MKSYLYMERGRIFEIGYMFGIIVRLLILFYIKGVLEKFIDVGGNNEYSNLTIVKLILDELGKPYELIEFVKDRPGHDLRYAIDSSKIKYELGWEPLYTFEDALRSTISWYVDKFN